MIVILIFVVIIFLIIVIVITITIFNITVIFCPTKFIYRRKQLQEKGKSQEKTK